MTTIDHIMQLCGDMPNASAHRHYLEQLPVSHQEQRLEDLLDSEKKHVGRWYGGQCIEPITTNRARMSLISTP